MEVKLVVARGKTSVQEIPLAGDRATIGRRNDCTLRIPSPLVSRQHCELTCEGNRLLVKDLGSSNGTFVNGSRIQQKELQSGDTLGIGPIIFVVRIGNPEETPETPRPSDAPTPAEPAGTGGSEYAFADEAAAGSAEDARDFIMAEEASADADVDFVVHDQDEASGDRATIQEAKAVRPTSRPAHPAMATERVSQPAAESPPPKKGGLLSRIFKRKQAPAEVAGTDTASTGRATKPTSPSHTGAAAEPSRTKSKPQETSAANPPTLPATAKAVGTPQAEDDELAEFLTNLNDKDE